MLRIQPRCRKANDDSSVLVEFGLARNPELSIYGSDGHLSFTASIKQDLLGRDILRITTPKQAVSWSLSYGLQVRYFVHRIHEDFDGIMSATQFGTKVLPVTCGPVAFHKFPSPAIPSAWTLTAALPSRAPNKTTRSF